MTDPPQPDREKGQAFRLLFVCTGNTCRSPMAEALARRALAQRGWDEVQVRSAGVGAGGGGPATEEAVRVAGRHGLDLSGHWSAPLDRELAEWADLILTMSATHLPPVSWLGGGDRSTVITAFARGEEGDPEAAGRGVADPIGGDDREYERTFQELEELVEKVLDRLEPLLDP